MIRASAHYLNRITKLAFNDAIVRLIMLYDICFKDVQDTLTYKDVK